MDQFGGIIDHAPARASPRFAHVRVGRLIEVRAPHGMTSLADINTFTAQVLAATWQTGGRALLCADYRRASPLMPEAAGLWSHAMRKANEYIMRSAVLLDPRNTMFNLQIARVVRCAGHAGHRRTFEDAAELSGWLADAATEAERQALDAFLSRRDD